MLKSLTEMTVEIIRAQLLNKDMSWENIVEALKSIFAALKELKDLETGRLVPSKQPEEEPQPGPIEPEPAAPMTQKPQDSIKQDRVICLECGQEFKQLSHTHLKRHDLTPKEYRKKHGFPAKQPLTAKSVSERRRKRAKETGLGGKLKEARESKK